MYEVSVISEFSSAHNLRGYKGKCENCHGHNWKVEAISSSKKLNSQGMVEDFKEIKKKLNNVLEALDHKNLNDLPYFKKVNPTSENIACYLYGALKKKIPDLKSVTVWENTASCATYEE